MRKTVNNISQLLFQFTFDAPLVIEIGAFRSKEVQYLHCTCCSLSLSLSLTHTHTHTHTHTCPCRLQEEQTINHIIFKCTQLENERRILQTAITRTGDTWPTPYEQLTGKHIKLFIQFVRSIDFSTL